MVKRLIPKMPLHTKYVEVFAGAAWLYFAKPPSKMEVINDIDNSLINMYRVFKEHPDEFVRCAFEVLYARHQFDYYRDIEPRFLTDIHKAIQTFYLIKTSFGSKSKNFAIKSDERAIYNKNTIPTVINQSRERLMDTLIENRHYSKIFEYHDSKETFFYIDPPYYNHEEDYGKGIFSKDDHSKIFDYLNALKGNFLLSMNDNELYRELYKDYKIEEIETRYSVNAIKSKPVTEILISNY